MVEYINTSKALKELRRAQREISDLPPTLLMDEEEQRSTLVAHMMRDLPYPITKDEKGIMAKIMVDALEWAWKTSMTEGEYREWEKKYAMRKERERVDMIKRQVEEEKDKVRDIRVFW